MTFVLRLSLAVSLLTLPALAQEPAPPPFISSPPETINSEAQRLKDYSAARSVLDNLLRQSFSVDNEYARWTQPICPHVYGLKPVAAWMVEHRIREVAQKVGAPVDRNDPCRPNVAIIFTVDPPATLKSIADAAPTLLEGGNQKQTVKYPVQAWYATFIKDYDNRRILDIPWEMVTPPLDGPPFVHTNDSRLHTGVTAEMAAATILVNSEAATGKTIGELSDYVALMTLAQAGQYGECEETTSIANLMLNCAPENTAHSLSNIDLALLKALYAVPESPEVLQRTRIIGSIRRTFEKSGGND